jgi:hypothetical protein
MSEEDNYFSDEEEQDHDNEENNEDNKNNSNDKNKPRDIFSENPYELGEGLTDEYEFTSEIRVEDEYSDKYLKDIYEYTSYVSYHIIREEILKIVENDNELYDLIYGYDKQKFNKDEINTIFSRIFEKMVDQNKSEKFIDPISIFDIISNIIGVKTKKIFDYLDYKYREILIIELNKIYGFLDDDERLF